MNSEQIQSFLSKSTTDKNPYVKVSFQKREPIYGLFLTTERDFKDLSTKNFWRIVSKKNFDQYKKFKDVNLSRIYNGSEITRLSLLTDEF
jgi:carboxypeptidase C (cathepsin A)